jgi:hypothetical protein
MSAVDAIDVGAAAVASATTPIEAALALGRLGTYVFPIDHPDLPQCVGVGRDHNPGELDHQRGKHPAVKFSERSTVDPKIIYSWFTGTTRNVGIHCGPSGLFVVDEDHPGELQRFADEHGQTIPPTFTVSTGKGAHYYFRVSNGQVFGNAEGAFRSYNINIRAGEAYVVAPSSRHASGATYTVTSALPPAPLPGWIADAVRGSRRTAADAPRLRCPARGNPWPTGWLRWRASQRVDAVCLQPPRPIGSAC